MKILGFTIIRGDIPKPVEKIAVQERHVLGAAKDVTLYVATDAAYMLRLRSPFLQFMPTPAEWHGRHFYSCEQAFAECPGAEVGTVTLWKCGDDYFHTNEVIKVDVQPKRKIDKGQP